MSLKLPMLRLAFFAAMLVTALALYASSSASAASSARQIVTMKDSFVFLNDDEDFPFDDEKATFNLSNKGFGIVAPTHRDETRGESNYCVGDEVRAAYKVRSQLDAATGRIWVTMSAQLFEGASCNTTDLEDSDSASFWLDPGKEMGKTLLLRNDVENSNDIVQLHLKLKNVDA